MSFLSSRATSGPTRQPRLARRWPSAPSAPTSSRSMWWSAAPGYAVDDLVVDVLMGSLPDTLYHRGGGTRRGARRLDPPVRRDAEHTGNWKLIDQVATAPDDRLKVLVDGAPRVPRLAGARWSDSGSTARTASSVARVRPRPRPARCHGCRSRSRPCSTRRPTGCRDLARHGHQARLGTARAQRQRATGRPPGRPGIRPSEVARLGYLTGIIATVLGRDRVYEHRQHQVWDYLPVPLRPGQNRAARRGGARRPSPAWSRAPPPDTPVAARSSTCCTRVEPIPLPRASSRPRASELECVLSRERSVRRPGRATVIDPATGRCARRREIRCRAPGSRCRRGLRRIPRTRRSSLHRRRPRW